MSKKYRYRPEIAKQDGVKEIDNNQDGRIDALEIDGQQEEFKEEKEYVEGAERPKGYELTDDEAATVQAGEDHSNEHVADTGEDANNASGETGQNTQTVQEGTVPSDPKVSTEPQGSEKPNQDQSSKPADQDHSTPSHGNESGNPSSGSGVVQADLTPITDTAEQIPQEPAPKLSEAESFGQSIKQRIDAYARDMGPNVSQTEASLVRHQVDLYHIFQTVLTVSEYDKFEAGIKALYAGFQENYALCFNYDARFRGIMNIPVSKLKEDQVEVLTSLIDLFCRLASAKSLVDLRGTYNFKTLKDNIYDQFVLSRFLGFVKKVIGDE